MFPTLALENNPKWLNQLIINNFHFFSPLICIYAGKKAFTKLNLVRINRNFWAYLKFVEIKLGTQSWNDECNLGQPSLILGNVKSKASQFLEITFVVLEITHPQGLLVDF